jgi:hypothetical protein
MTLLGGCCHKNKNKNVSPTPKKFDSGNSKLRNLVSEVVPAKVSEMSFQKKNTRSAELETGNSFWKLG